MSEVNKDVRIAVACIGLVVAVMAGWTWYARATRDGSMPMPAAPVAPGGATGVVAAAPAALEETQAEAGRSFRLVSYRNPVDLPRRSHQKMSETTSDAYYVQVLYDSPSRYKWTSGSSRDDLTSGDSTVVKPGERVSYEQVGTSREVMFVSRISVEDLPQDLGVAPRVESRSLPSELVWGKPFRYDWDSILPLIEEGRVGELGEAELCGVPARGLMIRAADLNFTQEVGEGDYVEVWRSIPDGIRLAVSWHIGGSSVVRERCVSLEYDVALTEEDFTITQRPGTPVITLTIEPLSSDAVARVPAELRDSLHLASAGASCRVRRSYVVSREYIGQPHFIWVDSWPQGWMVVQELEMGGGGMANLIAADAEDGPPVALKSRLPLVTPWLPGELGAFYPDATSEPLPSANGGLIYTLRGGRRPLVTWLDESGRVRYVLDVLEPVPKAAVLALFRDVRESQTVTR